MDGLDVKILRTMGMAPFGRTPRAPSLIRPSGLAKAVGASKERVRERIAKMEKANIIRGFQITPNYRHLGLESACYLYRFADDDGVDRAMETLKVAEGVMGCFAFLGGTLCVEVVYPNPVALERRLKVMTALAGEGGLFKFYDLDMPAVERPLGHLDWRIIQALRGRADRPLADVAKELKVSLKTVRRHFDRMGKEGSFFLTPKFDPSKAEGGLVFYLTFTLDAEAGADGAKGLRRALDAHVLSVDSPSTLELGHLNFMLFARNLAEVDTLRKKGAAIEGVVRAVPYLFRSVASRGRWQDEIIEEKVAATAPAHKQKPPRVPALAA